MKTSSLLQGLIFSLMLVSPLVNRAQTSFHPIVQTAQQTSYYSDGVDWNSINSEFLKLVGDGETVEHLRPGLQFLINSLRDKHGSFRSTKDFSLVVSYTGPTKPDNRKPEFVNTVINDVTARFSFAQLESQIGYLKVVGIGPQNTVKQEADLIRAALDSLAAKGVNRWILDLRFNGGGNINPMIAGLAPLIGEGFIGGAVNSKNELVQNYQIKQGQFYENDRLVCNMRDLSKVDTSQKVVVLLSRYTISSGEMLAVAFKGRPNTYFIGEETAGYTTGNGFDHVTDELVLVISQSVFADRNHNVYSDKVGVDEKSEFSHKQGLDDHQILRAIEWIESN